MLSTIVIVLLILAAHWRVAYLALQCELGLRARRDAWHGHCGCFDRNPPDESRTGTNGSCFRLDWAPHAGH